MRVFELDTASDERVRQRRNWSQKGGPFHRRSLELTQQTRQRLIERPLHKEVDDIG